MPRPHRRLDGSPSAPRHRPGGLFLPPAAPAYLSSVRIRLLSALASCLLALAALAAAAQSVDGVVQPGEYRNQLVLDKGNYRLSWTLEGGRLHAAMAAATDGWVAIGFDPVVVMDGADVVVGWVDSSGNARVLDAHSAGTYGPFVPDTESGGSNDILSFAGKESGGWTTLEFVRPQRTADRNDAVIGPQGGNLFFWAYGPGDGLSTHYTQYGQAYLRPQIASGPAGQAARVERRSLIGLTVAFLLMATASLLAWIGGLGGARLAVYQVLGWAGAGLALAVSVLALLGAAGTLAAVGALGLVSAGLFAAALVRVVARRPRPELNGHAHALIMWRRILEGSALVVTLAALIVSFAVTGTF